MLPVNGLVPEPLAVEVVVEVTVSVTVEPPVPLVTVVVDVGPVIVVVAVELELELPAKYPPATPIAKPATAAPTTAPVPTAFLLDTLESNNPSFLFSTAELLLFALITFFRFWSAKEPEKETEDI
jgi:hypothetical protein